jgi:hypothetical protein
LLSKDIITFKNDEDFVELDRSPTNFDSSSESEDGQNGFAKSISPPRSQAAKNIVSALDSSKIFKLDLV